MTRMTGPDCVVMCNLINTYIHTYIHTYIYTYIHTYSCIIREWVWDFVLKYFVKIDEYVMPLLFIYIHIDSWIVYKLGARGRQQQQEDSNKMKQDAAPQKNTRLRLFCEWHCLSSSLTTSFRFMAPYFRTNTTITDEKARKNMKDRTKNRTSHYGHYDREKDNGITCKTHIVIFACTPSLQRKIGRPLFTHWWCMWCVMRCHARTRWSFLWT